MKLDILNPLPGVYEGVPDKDYFAIKANSNSTMSRIFLTPAHSKCEMEDSDSKSKGRSIHNYALEISKFKELFVVTKKMNRNKLEWKALKKEAEENGKEIIQAQDYKQAYNVYNAIQRHPRAKELLTNCVFEQVVIWHDPDTGMLCKAKIDIVSDPALGYLADLKTTKDASPKAFARAVVNLGYHRQAYHYITGYNIAQPYYYGDFKIIACEIKPPYRVQVFTLNDEFMDLAQTEVQELMQKEAECIKNNQWDHFTTDPDTGYEIELMCPLWAHTRG